MIPKIDDEIFKKLINKCRDECILSERVWISFHELVQVLTDKIIEVSERVAELEKNKKIT